MGAQSVVVAGAGGPESNGWYHRRESAEGPPRACPWTRDEWVCRTGDRPWFEKDDGCYIVWLSKFKAWFCCGADCCVYYLARSQASLPPPARGMGKFPRRGSRPDPPTCELTPL